MNCFVSWLEAALKSGVELPQIMIELEQLIDKGKSMLLTAKTDLQKVSNMSDFEIIRIIPIITNGVNNLVKIHDGLPVLKEEANIAEKVAKHI